MRWNDKRNRIIEKQNCIYFKRAKSIYKYKKNYLNTTAEICVELIWWKAISVAQRIYIELLYLPVLKNGWQNK